ncbi:MAG: efflux RND transporter periplasmic adaptor subunit [Acidobacteriota bacterium]
MHPWIRLHFPRPRPAAGSSFVLAGLVVALAGCSTPDAERRSAPAGDAPPVEAVEARVGSLPLEVRLSGTVRASNQVTIRPEIEAAVVDVLVQSGERVDRGQLLVRLDDAALRDRMRQSEASVRLAEAQAREAAARVVELEAQAKRWRQLAEEEVVSRLDLETLEARLAAAQASAESADARVAQSEASADEARTRLAFTEVRAPISGRVGQRRAEPGLRVDSNSELFVIGDLDRVQVEVPLTEAMLATLDEGMPVRLGADAFDAPIDASLTRISPFLSEGSFSTVGEIAVDNAGGQLRPGMFVTVDVLYGQSERATLVPSSALWEDPRTGETVVFVVDVSAGAPGAELGESALPVERRRTSVEAEGRETVGLSGVEPGEWVVTVGHQLLEGDALEARVRAAAWDRVLTLQGLQQEDLLEAFLDKQQRLAETYGAVPPSTDDFAAAAQARVGDPGSPVVPGPATSAGDAAPDLPAAD